MLTRRTAAGATAAALSALPALLVLGPAPASARQQLDDAGIQSAIVADYLADDSIPSQRIDVDVQDGIVNLEGSVYNLLARDRAVKVAEAIKGVRSVVSMIEVNPVQRTDAQIRQDVREALLYDPTTDSYDIKAAVANGAVILRGQVRSYEQKQLSEQVVEGVRGVKAIDDELTVDYAATRPDIEIQAEIARLLDSDVRVDSRNIDVTVDEGKARLTGFATSAREKSRAASDAWVAGVRSVANDLEVRWWRKSDDLKRRVFQLRTDEQIEKAVKDAFLYDPRVESFNVLVHSRDGRVTLRGKVENLAAKKAAEGDAKHAAGVWSVVDQIAVRPQPFVADAMVVKRVQAALQRNPYLDRHDLTVSCYNGKVYLYGTTDTRFERSQAERAAWATSGVVDVQDNILVRQTWAWKSDAEIEQAIKDQLFWSPVVDNNEIQVTVENGVATLRGTVDTWHEYSTAAENAYQGGAKTVENRLHVKGAER